jgi:diaminopimelate epimerase
MPRPEVLGGSTAVLHGVRHPGTVATCGNPNLVCRVTDAAALDLTGVTTGALVLDPVTFPAGANVEFITAVDDLRVRMRVVERGVGETLSCGSGAVAAAAVVLRDAGHAEGTVGVEVPGGRLTVTVENGRWTLAGPAVIVATGHVAVDALLALDAVWSR